MRRLEAFLEVRVLTFCVMSNHFHLLVEIPDPGDVSQLDAASLRRRLPLLYQGAALSDALAELDRAEQNSESATGSSTWLDSIIARYQARMGDLSTFFKELKWRFSIWYNSHHQRVGTLWEDRFRSVLVEGDEHALMTIAAYIELNPVRAGLVDDPGQYRWSGYGEAMAGQKLARCNLARLHARMRAWQGGERPPLSWPEFSCSYRVYLFGQGERRLGDGHTGRGARPGIAAERVAAVVDGCAGKLPVHKRLLSRVRYFTDGAVIGSAEFVDEVFETQRERFGVRRKSGARTMRGANWRDLTTLRELRDRLFE